MIPRVAHFIWLQGRANLPAHLENLYWTFLDNHPDWKIEWWDHKRISRLPLRNRKYYDRAHKYVRPDSVYQMQSDIARYEILNRFGGAYFDMDYMWKLPIDVHLSDRDFVMCWEIQNKWVANGFIASVAGHPMLHRFITGLPDSVVNGSKRGLTRANRITGPQYVSRLVMGSDEVTLLDYDTLHPVPWYEPERCFTDDFPGSTAVHIWSHQRGMKGMDG